ncbi:hypothetical protein ACUJ46_11710 [Sandaracinobacteroides sp. A072]|uniref:hypothetical protein n=1 Tax=Sandaracinobacteroides sp. A072 TaxID=3461146 RepID=UPI00404287DA
MTIPSKTQATHAERMAEAKRRFVRLMQLMLAATLLVLVLAFSWLHATGTPLPFHFIVAISLAVIGSLMLAAALMGLVFFSHASGADDAPESIDDIERP